jgi:hypothetical protein
VVFAAVTVELAPVLLRAPRSQTWAICFGFFVGVFGFLLLGAMMPETDEDDDEEGEPESLNDGIQKNWSRRRLIMQRMRQAPSAMIRTLSRTLSGSPRDSNDTKIDWSEDGSMKSAQQGGSKKEVVNPVQATGDSADGEDSLSAEDKASVNAIESLSVEKTGSRGPVFPFTFATAVGVDAMVDGFLIGITSVSRNTHFCFPTFVECFDTIVLFLVLSRHVVFHCSLSLLLAAMLF